MVWLYLVIAGLFECAWAMVISFWLLSLAMRSIPVGTAYAVWMGIGAVGVAVLGMAIFGDRIRYVISAHQPFGRD